MIRIAPRLTSSAKAEEHSQRGNLKKNRILIANTIIINFEIPPTGIITQALINKLIQELSELEN